ncbi:hypothetical protein Q7N09_05370 (plasmid) [Candidatus Liberibacter asiaticus]
MAKRQEDYYITREEFIEFCTNSNSKQDCLFSALKNIAIAVTSLTAIIYGLLNIKGWFKQ